MLSATTLKKNNIDTVMGHIRKFTQYKEKGILRLLPAKTFKEAHRQLSELKAMNPAALKEKNRQHLKMPITFSFLQPKDGTDGFFPKSARKINQETLQYCKSVQITTAGVFFLKGKGTILSPYYVEVWLM
jgi:hypothetical protein